MQEKRFDGKRILIWGYGREGKSTENWLKKYSKPASLDVFEGDRKDIDEGAYDYIFKSPGIVLNEPFDKDKYTSQTEVFLEEYRDRTIGITGTKGKSTTSTLLYTVLSACSDRQVLLLGNIGKPCLDHYEDMKNDSIAVYEMSCHQLRHVKVSPHIGVFLNLYEDHLDYYGTMDEYFKAKTHVALYQRNGDYYYHGDNVPKIETLSEDIEISYDEVMNKHTYKLSLEGEHNQFNAEFVYRIACDRFGCDPDKVKEVMSTFTGLAHRLEYVGTYDGVRFLDDSISTIPEAAISALESVKDAATILLGGMDRGIDYDKLTDYIPRHPKYNYIFMYESGKRIYETEGIGSLDNTYYVEDLEKAVRLAKDVTDSGAVILSPAAASYGYFKNFEERGDVFKELAKLPAHQ